MGRRMGLWEGACMHAWAGGERRGHVCSKLPGCKRHKAATLCICVCICGERTLAQLSGYAYLTS